MTELTLFDTPVVTGKTLRDAGIKQAEDHANMLHEKWSDKAYEFLKAFLIFHDEFMAEDVRSEAQGIIPEPPSQRAWGAVILRAKREGLIVPIGFRNVKNAKAHLTPACLWKSKVFNK